MKSDLPLATKTIKELQVLARGAGIAGWHDLRKNDLIDAIQHKAAADASSKNKTHSKTQSKKKAKSVRESSSKPLAKKSKPQEESPKPASRKTPSTPESPSTTEQKRQPVRKKALEKASDLRKVASGRLVKSGPVEPKTAKSTPKPSGNVKKAASSPDDKTKVKEKKVVIKDKVTPKASEPVRKKAAPEKVSPKTTTTASAAADKKTSSPVPKKPIPAQPVKKEIKTPVKADNQKLPASTETYSKDKTAASSPASKQASNEVQKKISALKEKLLLHKTLGSDTSSMDREPRNQLILMVRDPFWLHAYWEMNSQLVDRIRAAMGHLWHTADPVLRLFRMHTDAGGTLRKEYLSDIRIHGGINNWYIDVDDPPSSFLVEIGYLARDGQFFILLSSNIVETPQRYVHDSFGHPDASWTGAPADFQPGHYLENGGDILSGNGINLDPASRSPMMSNPARTDSIASNWCDFQSDFGIKVDAELVIKGETTPHVQVAIKGENIRLKEDGSFSIRYHLPERRHVFPIAAVSPDGLETKTIILAVERNTKILETVVRDEDDE